MRNVLFLSCLLYFSCKEKEEKMSFQQQVLKETWTSAVISNNRIIEQTYGILIKNGFRPFETAIFKKLAHLKNQRDSIFNGRDQYSFQKIDKNNLNRYIDTLALKYPDPGLVIAIKNQTKNLDFQQISEDEWIVLISLMRIEGDVILFEASKLSDVDWNFGIYKIHTQSDTIASHQKCSFATVPMHMRFLNSLYTIQIQQVDFKINGQKIEQPFEIEPFGDVFVITFVPQKAGKLSIVGSVKICKNHSSKEGAQLDLVTSFGEDLVVK